MGADLVINRHETDPVEEIRRLTDGVGVPVSLEMSGSGAALEACLDATAVTGQVSILGLYSEPLTIDWSKKIVLKDLTVRGIYGRLMWRTWETMSDLIHNQGLDVTPVVTHRLPLERFEEGIAAMLAGASGKVVFFPDMPNDDEDGGD